jgi:hypothetical protein
MSKYPDLVQRLRGVNWVCHTYGKTEVVHDTVCHEAADAIELLQRELKCSKEMWEQQQELALEYLADIEKANERIADLEAAFREIYEVYAGSEGFIPETCAEGYQQQLIKEMADIAARHMRKGVKE